MLSPGEKRSIIEERIGDGMRYFRSVPPSQPASARKFGNVRCVLPPPSSELALSCSNSAQGATAAIAAAVQLPSARPRGPACGDG